MADGEGMVQYRASVHVSRTAEDRAVHSAVDTGPGFCDLILEALNYLAKLGWRLHACLQHACIMEKAGTI